MVNLFKCEDWISTIVVAVRKSSSHLTANTLFLSTMSATVGHHHLDNQNT